MKRFGDYSAVELSIIATGYYVKKNFEYGDKKELVETVSSLKSEYEKNWIEACYSKRGSSEKRIEVIHVFMQKKLFLFIS